MKCIRIILIFFTVISCTRPNQKEIVSFDSIDYSFFVGDFRSVKIFNTGQAFISITDEFSGQNDKYSLKLDPIQIDTLSRLVKSIFIVKLDSIYDEPIQDHPASVSLIVKYKDHIIRCSYKGDFNNKEFTPLFHISEYLNGLIYNVIEQADSIFVFESKSRLFIPRPPRN
jgi:hypothetical protein